MAIEVRINDGEPLDLPDNANVKYTKQVSDIFDVAAVKASHTNSFELPKSPNNTMQLRGLGLVGHTSAIPYEFARATMRDGVVEVVREGRFDVKETGDTYKANIIDGAVDFFKSIENQTLGDVPMPELNHSKTMATVIASFTNEYYRYIVADYNGKAFHEGRINIDYLVPSARYRYILDRIFEHYGWSVSGQIFSDPVVNSRWVTYPKSNISEDVELEEVGELGRSEFIDYNPVLIGGATYHYPAYQQWTSVDLDEGTLQPNDWGYVVENTGFYSIDVTARGRSVELGQIFSGTVTRYRPIQLTFLVNGAVRGTVLIPAASWLNPASALNTQFEGILMEGDVVSFEFRVTTWDTPICLEVRNLDVTIRRAVAEVVDFSTELRNLKITDFIHDFMRRFALTMIPDVQNRQLRFMSLSERISREDSVDWSSKFIRRNSEKYLYGSYAQLNFLRHKYNGDNEDFNDGVLGINNVNLPAEKTLATSIFYSATNQLSFSLGPSSFATFIYPIWEKEPGENGEIKYKELTGRWYLIGHKPGWGIGNFISERTGEEADSPYPIVDSHMTHFRDLVPVYWSDYSALMNNAKVYSFQIALTAIDVSNYDFSRCVYLEQEQAFFLINKIEFTPGDFANVEAVKINY